MRNGGCIENIWYEDFKPTYSVPASTDEFSIMSKIHVLRQICPFDHNLQKNDWNIKRIAAS